MTTGLYKKGMVLAIIGLFLVAGTLTNVIARSNNSYMLESNNDREKLNQRTYLWENSRLKCVQQTGDGGYIITGFTTFNALGIADALLIKTDENGIMMWNKTFYSADMALSVQQTSDGGHILTGRTEHHIYDDNVWLIKTDGNGNMLWEKQFGTAGDDEGYSVQQTNDGGFIIVGMTEIGYNNSNDIWLIKTDNNGNDLWNMKYGLSGDDSGYSVQQTTDNGFIITGRTLSFGNSSQLWLIKTDQNGSMIWNNTFGGKEYECGYCVQFTNDGGFIVTGSTSTFGKGRSDAWLIKTDSNGNMVWNYTFGGENEDLCYCVKQTEDTGYILTGKTGGADLNDVWLIKTDENGIMMWNKSFGGTENEEGNYVIQTTDGGYIIAGFTETHAIESFRKITWLIKTDSNGKHLWDTTFKNKPPAKPEKPSGEIRGKTGEDYTYSTSTSDPEGEQIWYNWNWGNNEISGWLGPYDSGDTVTASHIWDEQGSYEILVKSKDIHGMESDWSDPLPITMPKNKAINSPFLNFLENHPRMFPLLRQLLSCIIYDEE